MLNSMRLATFQQNIRQGPISYVRRHKIVYCSQSLTPQNLSAVSYTNHKLNSKLLFRPRGLGGTSRDTGAT
jgi:hypothetical protein